MSDFLTAGSAADQLGVAPRAVTDALYRRLVDVSRCPVIAGRRMIPVDLLPAIRQAIEARRPEPVHA